MEPLFDYEHVEHVAYVKGQTLVLIQNSLLATTNNVLINKKLDDY
jgi:hypothetical protein